MTSTAGDSAVTVSVSSTAPTCSSLFTVALKVPSRTMLPRRTDLNPASVKLTRYVPGLRSTILYWPELSVTTDRVFSIRAGLDASTRTPGMTDPDESLTTPAIAAWALLVAGTRNTAALRTIRHITTRRISLTFCVGAWFNAVWAGSTLRLARLSVKLEQTLSSRPKVVGSINLAYSFSISAPSRTFRP